jgi:hypothetical protein
MALQPKNELTYAEGFKEDEHPRGGEGTKEGGRFVPKGGKGTPTKDKGEGEKKEPESKPEDSPFKEHKPERPKLREGLSYGDDITIDQLQIGDTIQASGDKSISSISGKITKVNPKTIVLVTKYFDNDMTLTVKKSDLRGMVVVGRGDKVHVVNKDEEA